MNSLCSRTIKNFSITRYTYTSEDRASRSLPRSVEPFFLVSPQEILHFALSLSTVIHILCMGLPRFVVLYANAFCIINEEYI